jgi:hypothetical protein
VEPEVHALNDPIISMMPRPSWAGKTIMVEQTSALAYLARQVSVTP